MASPSTSWSTYQFFLSSLLILIFVFLLSIAYHFFIARRNRAHVAGPLSPPPATALKAGTPPRLPHGLATICSTFSLGGTGTVSEPNAPVYNAPRRLKQSHPAAISCSQCVPVSFLVFPAASTYHMPRLLICAISPRSWIDGS